MDPCDTSKTAYCTSVYELSAYIMAKTVIPTRMDKHSSYDKLKITYFSNAIIKQLESMNNL